MRTVTGTALPKYRYVSEVGSQRDELYFPIIYFYFLNSFLWLSCPSLSPNVQTVLANATELCHREHIVAVN